MSTATESVSLCGTGAPTICFSAAACAARRLIRASSPGASVELFLRENLDALAGIRPMLNEVAQAHAGVRVLPGSFTAVQQAIGAPKALGALIVYLQKFVEEIKNSGLLAAIIERTGLSGVSVAHLSSLK